MRRQTMSSTHDTILVVTPTEKDWGREQVSRSSSTQSIVLYPGMVLAIRGMQGRTIEIQQVGGLAQAATKEVSECAEQSTHTNSGDQRGGRL